MERKKKLLYDVINRNVVKRIYISLNNIHDMDKTTCEYNNT